MTGTTPSAPSPGDELFALLTEEYLQRPGITRGRMFRGVGLSVAGKLFAFVGKGDRLIAKLPRERCEQEIAAGRASALQMRGRAMTEWAELPLPEDPTIWSRVIRDAHDYVAALHSGD